MIPSLVSLLASVTDAANNPDPAARSRELADLRHKLDAADRATADELPPLDTSNARKLAEDPEIRSEIHEWRNRRGYASVDVSDLPDEHGEKWEIIRGSSRYEVREVRRYEARPAGKDGKWWCVHDHTTDDMADGAHVGEDGDGLGTEEQARIAAQAMNDDTSGPVYLVWDTDNDEPVNPDGGDDCPSYDPTDEDDARTSADQGNLEDYRNNANGWPFAHNYAATIEEHEADDFDRAGFVVAQYDGGTCYAGIDGGGYDFTSAHWSPLFFASFARYGGYVRTRDGLRRVAPAGG